MCPKPCFGHTCKVSVWNSHHKCHFCHFHEIILLSSQNTSETIPKFYKGIDDRVCVSCIFSGPAFEGPKATYLKEFHLTNVKFSLHYNACIEFRRNLDANLLVRLVVLLAVGCQAMTYVDPCTCTILFFKFQEDVASLRRKLERAKKIEMASSADEVLMEEIREYKVGVNTFHAVYISLACCKTAITPVHYQWSYCSFALSHRYIQFTRIISHHVNARKSVTAHFLDSKFEWRNRTNVEQVLWCHTASLGS